MEGRKVSLSVTKRVRVLGFFFQAEDGIRDAQESRGLGDVYKRQGVISIQATNTKTRKRRLCPANAVVVKVLKRQWTYLSLIHI